MTHSAAERVPGPYYRRDRTGTTIHHDDCPHAGRTSVTWTYADGFDADAICLAMVNARWLRACGHCRPDRPRTSETDTR